MHETTVTSNSGLSKRRRGISPRGNNGEPREAHAASGFPRKVRLPGLFVQQQEPNLIFTGLSVRCKIIYTIFVYN